MVVEHQNYVINPGLDFGDDFGQLTITTVVPWSVRVVSLARSQLAFDVRGKRSGDLLSCMQNIFSAIKGKFPKGRANVLPTSREGRK